MPGWFGALIQRKNGKNGKIAPGKKVPQGARLSAGGGGELLFGQCPHRGGDKLKGASLTDQTWFFFIKTESHSPNLPVKRSLIGIVGHVTSIDETSAGSQPPKRDSPVIVGLWAEFRWKSPL